MKNKKIYSNCPECHSGNSITSNSKLPYKCDDCGSIVGLIEIELDKIESIDECLICKCNSFFKERTINLLFFKKNIFCYRCDARYLNFDFKNNIVDNKFNLKKEKELKNEYNEKFWEY